MIRTDETGGLQALVRIEVGEDDQILGQQLFGVDGWVSWPHMEWTGVGGATEWQPISEADVFEYLPEGVEIHGPTIKLVTDAGDDG